MGRPATSETVQNGDPQFELWLSASLGYRVLTPHGRLGAIKEIVYATDGRPAAIIVATGFLGARRQKINIDEIDWVVPAGRRVFLSWPVAGSIA